MEFISGLIKTVGFIIAALFGLTYFQVLSHANLESPLRVLPIPEEKVEAGGVILQVIEPLTELLGLVGLTSKPAGANSFLVSKPVNDHSPNRLHLKSSRPVMYPIEGSFRISSGFGMRIDPFTGDKAFHNGIDIPLKPGTPIRVTGGWTLTDTGDHPRLGYFVKIAHGDYLKSIYGHFQELL